MRLRIALSVCGLWLLIAILWGAQTSIGSSVMGAQPIPLARGVRSALQQVLPWVPVTLAVIALAVRFPLSRQNWPRYAVVHLVAAAVLALVANIIVVLMYWASTGTSGSLTSLVKSAGVWATVNFHIAAVIYASILGITQAILYYRRTQARELQLAKVEGQLAEARLQALNAQIRPHFLFNTLHTIGQLWRSGRSDDADTVLDHLGALFHK